MPSSTDQYLRKSTGSNSKNKAATPVWVTVDPSCLTKFSVISDPDFCSSTGIYIFHPTNPTPALN